MSRKSFRQLLQKYLRGECTAEEKSFVEHWYGLLEAETGDLEKNMDTDELEARLWEQIQSKMEVEESIDDIEPLYKRLSFGWLGIAASLLLVATWWFIGSWNKKTPTDSVVASDWLYRTNTATSPILIRLEDGSKVQLSPKSTLRFPKHFEKHNRTVYLNGDAFFDIQKSPARPFYVHTDRVIAKVLGTSFFVRTDANTKHVRVEVVTGRVAVYGQSAEKRSPVANGVVLSPNQAATYYDEQKHFVTGLVEKPALLETPEAIKQELTFQFDDTPLSEVIRRLELAYGIDIVVENEQQNNCLLTADLSNQPLYNQLDLICAALKAQYEIQGTIILLSGKGCN